MKHQLKKNPIFDIKMGTIGAFFLGSIVYMVNIKHGDDLALMAAGKQALYTFLIGGVMTRMTENLAIGINKKKLALIMAVAIPTIITSMLTLGMHSLKGTPEPFASTLPTFFFAPIGFWGWAVRKRKQTDKFKLTD